MEAVGVSLRPTVYNFVHISLPANVNCNESLVILEASGSCHTSNTNRVLVGTPPGCSVVALCGGDPETVDLHCQPFHVLQKIIDGVHVRVGQLKALNPGLEGNSQLVRSPAVLGSHHQG